MKVGGDICDTAALRLRKAALWSMPIMRKSPLAEVHLHVLADEDFREVIVAVCAQRKPVFGPVL
jgi:hypothetical protein